MKKQLTILGALAVAALSSFYFAGCTQSDTVTTNNAAYGLMATSVDANTIGLRWTRDASDASDDTVYTTASDGSAVAPRVVVSPGNSATISGLHIGTTYTFTIHSTNATSSSISWMTANRYNNVSVYEFDATGPSGLVLKSGTNFSLTDSAAASHTIDFWLDEDQTSPSGLMLKGGQRYDPNWRHSYVMKDSVLGTNGSGSALDISYSSADFSAFMQQVAAGTGTLYNQFAIPATANGSRIITVETADDNLARIELIPNGSSYIYGSGSNRYIMMNISYQPSVNKPYATRPHARRGYEAPKTVF